MDSTPRSTGSTAHVNLESVGLPPSATRRGSAPTLERIEALVALLGSPQLSYPAIHVTGTNGKTSVVRIAVELLTASGLSVGAYTSPHLERVNERLAWNDEPIADDDLADLLTRIAAVEGHLPDRPSYFEILTAAAFGWFADIAVDVAVVEVGVGGTWDATNVVDGQVAVVTNVSVDHVEYLGPTRAEIAAEKAGIVKPDSILVLGETDPELAPIFHEPPCVDVLARDIDFGVRSERARARRAADRPLHAHEPLRRPAPPAPRCAPGRQRRHRARGGRVLPRPIRREGGARPRSRTVRSPGRLEVVHREPLVMLDGAHNVAGAEALRAALDDEFPPAARTFVIGLLREKDPREMLEALEATDAARIICCRPPSARALDPEEIAETAIDLGVDEDRVTVVSDVAAAVALAIERTPEDSQVVVTGSLYVVGAARHALVG